MQKQIIQSLAVLIGTILLDFLFFKEFLGLNLLVSTLFFEAALFYFYRESFSHRNVQLVAGGTLILALCVVFTNSKLAEAAYLLSFSFLVGLTQLPELRFLFFGSALYAFNFLEVPKNFANGLTDLPVIGSKKGFRNYFLPVLMALIIGFVFFLIYFLANPRFADASTHFFDFLARIFIFRFDFGHILYFGVCFFISGATLWKHRLFDFAKFQNNFQETDSLTDVISKSINTKENTTAGFDANKSGIILLGTINLLLLLNNTTDLAFVWLNKHADFSTGEMKSFVHEGTYLLIFGILLAMCVLLFLFRRSKIPESLNGSNEENKSAKKHSTSLLHILAIIWLVQNTFLTLSVGIRNAHYINAFGLAYKRIGVIFFLVLVLCCLWFLYEKIKNADTFFRFISRNAWSFYLVLVAASCVSWDTLITRYNIKNTPPKDLDVRFLLNNVSDKNTYQLIENKNYLLDCAAKSNVSLSNEMNYRQAPDKLLVEKEFDEQLSAKLARLNRRLGHTNWRSWNYPDYVNGKFLEENKK